MTQQTELKSRHTEGSTKAALVMACRHSRQYHCRKQCFSARNHLPQAGRVAKARGRNSRESSKMDRDRSSCAKSSPHFNFERTFHGLKKSEPADAHVGIDQGMAETEGTPNQ